MCEECEEAEPLREAYLARRARMVQTWRPSWQPVGRRSVDAAVPASASSHPEAEAKLTAAE
jgi:hypothetical protein